MKFLEFVSHSDFQKYYFLIHQSKVEGKTLHLEFTKKDCNFPKGTYLDINFTKYNKFNQMEEYYCLNELIACNASLTAKFVDLSNAFEFESIYHYSNGIQYGKDKVDEIYIYLKLKDNSKSIR